MRSPPDTHGWFSGWDALLALAIILLVASCLAGCGTVAWRPQGCCPTCSGQHDYPALCDEYRESLRAPARP